VPSTIANIMDFLTDYKHIVDVNESISYLYIVYQFFLMVSTVLGPATVLLMITGAYNACLGTSLWQSFSLAVGPALFYLLLCYITTTDFQIRIAAFMSAIYAVIMMAVIVGTTIQIAEDSWTSPNAIFLMLLIVIFLVAAIMHPQEFWCIVPGMLYFLCIPSGYLLLLIYSLCNLNIVSWGTREVEKRKHVKKKTKEEEEKAKIEAKKEQAKKAKKGFFSQFTINIVNPTKYSTSLRNFLRDWLGIESNETNNVILRQILGTLERIEKIKNEEEVDGMDLGFINPEDIVDHNERVNDYHQRLNKSNAPSYVKITANASAVLRKRAGQSFVSNNYYAQEDKIYQKQRNELINPAWIEVPYLNDSEIDFLDPKETDFFQKMIDRYLYPLVEDKNYQAKVARDLKALRNNGCFAFFMINALWMVIIFHLQLVQYKVRDYIYVPIPRLNYEPLRFEPLGFSFLIFFASILLVQFFSMLWHRYGTVLHLLASTDLKVCARKFNINQMEVEDVVQTVKVLQQIKGFEEEDLPVPDYDTEKQLLELTQKQEQQQYASKLEAYNYHESNFYARNAGTNGAGGGPGGAGSMISNYNQNQNYSNSNNPYPRQHKLLKSQILNNGGVADSNNTLERNLDVTSIGSKLYDADGAASVYVPIGNASSIQTYNSNYLQSKYRQNKKSSYNKSLDVVFRRRWHALSQGKGHQIKNKPRVKVNDIFIHQVSSNIHNMQRQSKQSMRSNNNDHAINIDDV
jgi:chitin synthase